MRAPAKAQRRRRRLRRYRGCRLERVGSQTIVIALPSGEVWGWAASWAQARRVVTWIRQRPREEQA
jgi:hypothetical protein